VNVSVNGRKQCVSYEGRLGVILAHSELQQVREART